MGDRGCKQILDAVAQHTSLLSVRLGANSGSDETAGALCDVLEGNPGLRCIDMSSNCLAEHGDAIQSALQNAERLRVLKLHCCGLPEDVTAAIGEHLQRREEEDNAF